MKVLSIIKKNIKFTLHLMNETLPNLFYQSSKMSHQILWLCIFYFWAFQMVLMVKNPVSNAGDIETQVRSLGQEDPLERKRHLTTVFLQGESHGQRSLAASSPWVTVSDTTECLIQVNKMFLRDDQRKIYDIINRNLSMFSSYQCKQRIYVSTINFYNWIHSLRI